MRNHIKYWGLPLFFILGTLLGCDDDPPSVVNMESDMAMGGMVVDPEVEECQTRCDELLACEAFASCPTLGHLGSSPHPLPCWPHCPVRLLLFVS